MKFTVQMHPLVRMLELVGERTPGRKRGTERVRLLACQDRVCVARGSMVAESEAVVWSDGWCIVSLPKLLSALKASGREDTLTLEARAQRLMVGGCSIPMLHYSPSAVIPSEFQVFLATDLGVVASESIPTAELAKTA